MRRTRKSNWLLRIQQFVILNASPVAFRNHACQRRTPTQELHGWRKRSRRTAGQRAKAQISKTSAGLPVSVGRPKAPVFAMPGSWTPGNCRPCGSGKSRPPDLPSAGPEDQFVRRMAEPTLSSPHPGHSVSRRLMLLGGGVVAAAAAIGLTRVIAAKYPLKLSGPALSETRSVREMQRRFCVEATSFREAVGRLADPLSNP